jgi:PAS domain S-box-containing protein
VQTGSGKLNGSQAGGPLERLDLFFDLSVDLLTISDASGNLLRLNPAWERALGYRLPELYAMKWIDLVHPDDRQRTLAEFKRIDEAGRSSFENRYRHRDGSYRWLEWSAIRGPEGLYYSVARDVTERRTERERLRASEAYKSAVHSAAMDAIVAFDAEGRVVDVNEAAERTFGYRGEQLLGQPIELTLVPPDQRAAWRADLVRYRKAPNAIVDFRSEHMGQRADGSRFPIELTVARLEAGRAVFAAFVRDLTDTKRADDERRGLEEQVRQAQKMEAIGRLAGNVAHDFHELISAISAFTDVAEPVVKTVEPARERLEKVKEAATNAVGLVDQLMAFSRRQALSTRVLDINETIVDLEQILRGLAGGDVSFQVALDEALSPAKADPAQLQQALVNLVINAREAMSDQERRRRRRGGPAGAGRAARRLRPDLRRGHGRGHVARGGGARAGAVLHDEGGRRRGPGAVHRVRHRRPERRLRPHRVDAGPRDHRPDPPARRPARRHPRHRGGAPRGHGAAGRGRGGRSAARAAHPGIARVQGAAGAPRRRGAGVHPPARPADPPAAHRRRHARAQRPRAAPPRHRAAARDEAGHHVGLHGPPDGHGRALHRQAVHAVRAGQARERDPRHGDVGSTIIPSMTDTLAAEPPRARELITTLGMAAHPERGYYVETYRSPLQLDGLPHGGQRAASTAIYFLVTRAQPTTYLHRLRSDELFHLYEGGPLDVLLLREDGAGEVARLGRDVAAGERPQLVIRAGTWFAVELSAQGADEHCLFGCTVAPGFEFADFELAAGPELAARYPAHAARIGRMTRP